MHPGPRSAHLRDPGQDALRAVRRVEGRLDRLADWLAAWSRWYAQAHPPGEAEQRRRRRLVAIMLLVFVPVIALLVWATRTGL